MQKAHFQSIRRFLLRKPPLFDLAGDRMSSKDEISVKANEYFEFLKKQYDGNRPTKRIKQRKTD